MMILLFGLLLLCASLYLLLPLLRTGKVHDVSDRLATNQELFNDHQMELKQSLDQGRITEVEFNALNTELGRNLLADNEQIDRGESHGNGKSLLIGTLILLPLLSLFLYHHFGAYPTLSIQNSIDDLSRYRISESATPEGLLEKQKELLEQVKQRVSNHPEDIRSNALLARMSFDLQDFYTSEASYRRLIDSEEQPQASWFAQLASILLRKDTESAQKEGRELAATAININPKDPVALRLMGMIALKDKKPFDTLRYWRRAVAELPANSISAAQLNSSIDTLNQALIDNGITEVDPTVDQQKDTNQANVGTTVKVYVVLGAHVDTSPTDKVFVYARKDSLSKMPLSIVSLNVKDLPATVVLSDAQSMAPNVKLSGFEQVELVARVSKSGRAIAESGDWQGIVSSVNVSDQNTVKLVIDTPIE